MMVMLDVALGVIIVAALLATLFALVLEGVWRWRQR